MREGGRERDEERQRDREREREQDTSFLPSPPLSRNHGKRTVALALGGARKPPRLSVYGPERVEIANNATERSQAINLNPKQCCQYTQSAPPVSIRTREGPVEIANNATDIANYEPMPSVYGPESCSRPR